MAKLLIVDDDPEGVEALRFRLESLGDEVRAAPNGREALRLLRADPWPDVVILDLLMPLMDGWQFLDAVRGDPQLGSVPVVVVTGSLNVRPINHQGAVFAKPVDVDALVAHVRRICPEPSLNSAR